MTASLVLVLLVGGAGLVAGFLAGWAGCEAQQGGVRWVEVSIGVVPPEGEDSADVPADVPAAGRRVAPWPPSARSDERVDSTRGAAA